MRIGLKERLELLAGCRLSFLLLSLLFGIFNLAWQKKIPESKNGPKDCTQFALSSGEAAKVFHPFASLAIPRSRVGK
jgi:hypothetical protein